MIAVYSQIQGIWIAAIGWFLMVTASSGYRQNQISELFKRYKVRDLMITDLQPIPSGTLIEAIASEKPFPDTDQYFVVTAQYHNLGLIDLKRVSKIPTSRWSRATVDSIMDHIAGFLSLPPETNASSALGQLEEHGSSVALVMENKILLGLFHPKTAIRATQ